jgi:hypothetical protein
VDVLLRPGRGPAPLGPALLAVFLGGAVYGAVMGSFAGHAAQVLVSAVKVPLLLLLTTALALPSFFVLNTLAGLRREWPEALRAVLGSQGAVALVLGSLAPYTAFWYASSGDYHAATTFNGLIFLVAAAAAQFALRRAYAPLVAANPRHGVAIQLAWVLRPFVGNPDQPVTFFRAGAWGNAYVEVADIAWKAVNR